VTLTQCANEAANQRDFCTHIWSGFLNEATNAISSGFLGEATGISSYHQKHKSTNERTKFIGAPSDFLCQIRLVALFSFVAVD